MACASAITPPYVFWHHDGLRYRRFAGPFAKIADRAGVECLFHDLRHSYASEFLKRNPDLPALGRNLGHKSITQTMRYAHHLTDHLHEAVKKAGTKTGTRATD